MSLDSTSTRQQILQAALNQFADRSYAGTSVQDIVAAAQVTKPALYYHFGNKAGLYKALLDQALGEQLRLMKEAAVRGTDLQTKLAEILTSLLQFAREQGALTRILFSTAYGSPNEMPREARPQEKCARNFEFLHNLLKKELITGELDRRFESHELAGLLFGLINICALTQVSNPKRTLDRSCAERTVKLFLDGASAKRPLSFSRNK